MKNKPGLLLLRYDMFFFFCARVQSELKPWCSAKQNGCQSAYHICLFSVSHNIAFLCMWHETCTLETKIKQDKEIHYSLIRLKLRNTFVRDFRPELFLLLICVTVNDMHVVLILNLCLRSYWCFSCSDIFGSFFLMMYGWMDGLKCRTKEYVLNNGNNFN